jgi:Ca-activated chloride channel family protein
MLAMKVRMSVLIVLLLSVALSHAEQVEKAQTLRVEVSLVTVGVRVTDAWGHEVPDLRAKDFTLYEDGVAQQIEFFSNEEQPISLVILLDRSDSMGLADKLKRAKAAAQLIVDTSHRESEYLFMAFDIFVVVLDNEFTENRDRVRRAIAATELGQGTRLYDAVLDALERCKRAKYGRQALVVITDGTDQHSHNTLDQMIAALQESQVQLYAIGYYSSSEDEIYRKSGPTIILGNNQPIDNPRTVFKRLAKESGAEAFFPRSDKELQSDVGKILKDLRTQYTLAYYPSNPAPDNRYRRIQAKLRPRGLRVRARPGYILPSRTR